MMSGTLTVGKSHGQNTITCRITGYTVTTVTFADVKYDKRPSTGQEVRTGYGR